MSLQWAYPFTYTAPKSYSYLIFFYFIPITTPPDQILITVYIQATSFPKSIPHSVTSNCPQTLLSLYQVLLKNVTVTPCSW